MAKVAVGERREIAIPPAVVEAANSPSSIPIAVGLVCFVAVILALLRVGQIAGWSSQVSDVGSVVVAEACTPKGFAIAAQWRCSAYLEADETPVVLITPRSGYVDAQPFVGQSIRSFRIGDDEENVYPQGAQMPELTALFFSLVARSLVAVGAAIWLGGWLSTLESSSGPAGDSFLLVALGKPGRARPKSWKDRGVRWVAAGVIVGVVNVVVIQRLIGALSIY